MPGGLETTTNYEEIRATGVPELSALKVQRLYVFEIT